MTINAFGHKFSDIGNPEMEYRSHLPADGAVHMGYTGNWQLTNPDEWASAHATMDGNVPAMLWWHINGAEEWENAADWEHPDDYERLEY